MGFLARVLLRVSQTPTSWRTGITDRKHRPNIFLEKSQKDKAQCLLAKAMRSVYLPDQPTVRQCIQEISCMAGLHRTAQLENGL
jgi:hypothetical protein